MVDWAVPMNLEVREGREKKRDMEREGERFTIYFKHVLSVSLDHNTCKVVTDKFKYWSRLVLNF